jgi:hypothetical protein
MASKVSKHLLADGNGRDAYTCHQIVPVAAIAIITIAIIILIFT